MSGQRATLVHLRARLAALNHSGLTSQREGAWVFTNKC